jgi:hypothetical protein
MRHIASRVDPTRIELKTQPRSLNVRSDGDTASSSGRACHRSDAALVLTKLQRIAGAIALIPARRG